MNVFIVAAIIITIATIIILIICIAIIYILKQMSEEIHRLFSEIQEIKK